MTPQSQPRKPRNSSRANLIIALVFHALLVFVILYFAAQNGLIGERLKKLTVSMIKEPPPEKPKEPEKSVPEPPKEAPRETPPKMVEVAPASPPASAPPAVEPSSVMAPPPVDMPSFDFQDGARPVETATPARLYKGLVEYTLRANWDRPTDVADSNYFAEVEIQVNSSGQIIRDVWKRGSGDQRWDKTVRDAIARTRELNRPPPTGFPDKVLVRFDTATEPEQVIQ